MVRTRGQVAAVVEGDRTRDSDVLRREFLQALDDLVETRACLQKLEAAQQQREVDVEFWHGRADGLYDELLEMAEAEKSSSDELTASAARAQEQERELDTLRDEHATDLRTIEELEARVEQAERKKPAVPAPLSVPAPLVTPDNAESLRVSFVRICVFYCVRDGLARMFHIRSPTDNKVGNALREATRGLDEQFVVAVIARGTMAYTSAMSENTTVAIAQRYDFQCVVHGIEFTI